MAHGDFYFTINATFYHFTEQWGEQALIDYWRAMGSQYLRPLAERFKAGGPEAIAAYWSEYFAAEPGAEVSVSLPDLDSVNRREDLPGDPLAEGKQGGCRSRTTPSVILPALPAHQPGDDRAVRLHF